MKKLVILGAGSGGTMMANKLRRDLDDEWSITLIDKDNVHYYQPGFLFVPFDINKPQDIRRSRREFIKPGIDFIISDTRQCRLGQTGDNHRHRRQIQV